MQQPDFYQKGMLKLVPRWDKCINLHRDYTAR